MKYIINGLFALVITSTSYANLCESLPAGEFNCLNTDKEEWSVRIAHEKNALGLDMIAITPRGNGDSFYDRLAIYWPTIVVPLNSQKSDYSERRSSMSFEEFDKVICKRNKIIVKTKTNYSDKTQSKHTTIYRLKDHHLKVRTHSGLFHHSGFDCSL